MVLAHHSLEGIPDQILLIITEDTEQDRLTDNRETMDGGEEGMVLSTLLEEAFILHHILHHQGEAQVPVIIINHMVGEEDLGIGKEHLDIIKGDQVIDKEDQETEGVSPEIEVDHIDNGVIHLVMETTDQEAIVGVRTHKGLRETIMDPEEEVMVEDQQHQNKIIVCGVAVQAI